jgi:hypothetical protein
MSAVRIRDAYLEVFKPFGEIQAVVDSALRRYAIEKANEKIAELRGKVKVWEDKYGCTYEVFAYRTATDEDYVRELNKDFQTAMWEGDSIVWEFEAKELAKWYQRLRDILGGSS